MKRNISLKQKRSEAENAIMMNTGSEKKDIHVCMADDMHPYNCDGMYGGSCIHCERKVEDGHNPTKCSLYNFFEDDDE